MDISALLYPQEIPHTPVAGEIIIAEPIMKDPYFSRSAALILDTPSGGGHFGLILNKSTDLTLKDLMPEWNMGSEVPVYCGGPVDMQRMFLLHTLGPILGKEAEEIMPGLYVGADIDAIIDYVEKGGVTDGFLRFFLGYCGWSPGQLDDEISRFVWAVTTAGDTGQLLRGTGIEYWQKEVKRLGENYRSWLNVPLDPSYN